MTEHFSSHVSKFSKACFFDGLSIELLGQLVHHICVFFFSDIYLSFFPQQSDDIRPFMYLIIIVT